MSRPEASSASSLNNTQSAGNSIPADNEPGSRRRKLAGYLKAANELRHAYQQGHVSQWGDRGTQTDAAEGAPMSASVVKSGDEEMILFPSYARRHVKSKPQSVPGTIQEAPGSGRDVRDSGGTGDAEFWRQEWEKYEDDNAIVDVDVRGWIYSPHKGPMTRKARLFVGLARQLVGIPAQTSARTSPSASPSSSRASSPHRSHRDRVEARTSRLERNVVSKEAEAILERGEAEAAIAQLGGYSKLGHGDDAILDGQGAANQEQATSGNLAQTVTRSSSKSDDTSSVAQRTSSNQSSAMSPEELSVANAHLMARLKPFLANPLANSPISAFFYNDKISRQRTVNTDSSGHFTIRAALDFIPTHVRILASEKLSVTEEVLITEPKGVSLISDIDDTIKHSAISSGAREIFRNTFIRDLDDLTIEGVKEWYNRLADLGVKIHYVSNSPWQMYPVLKSFFSMAGLPPGSFHLKQYSGMLQGIFEPVAERKKSTLDKLMHDFPDRRFLLVGDSGEADLEVYTDVVLENPGRILGVFIRDVTTPAAKGFFDSAMGPLTGDRRSNNGSMNGNASGGRSEIHHSSTRNDEDRDLRAAIAASLRDIHGPDTKDKNHAISGDGSSDPLHGFNGENRPSSLRGRPRQPVPEAQKIDPPIGDLIDFSDEDGETESTPQDQSMMPANPESRGRREHAHPSRSSKPKPPVKPAKPLAFRSGSMSGAEAPVVDKAAPPPPKPPRPSASDKVAQLPEPIHTSHSQHPSGSSNSNKTPHQQGYRAAAMQRLSSAYSHVPSPSAYWHGTSSAPTMPSTEGNPASTRELGTAATAHPSQKPPPPVPPRRNLSSYPAAAAQYASNRVSSLWTDGSGDRLNGAPVVNKREELWKRRWETAQQILQKHGVVLRSWRIGSDAMDECVRLVERAQGEAEGRGR